MPEDQSQLGHLLALLAQLQQGRLARCGLHKLRNPVEHAPVLFRHADIRVGLHVVRRAARHDAIAGDSCSIVARDPLVVLLLGLCGSSSGGGGLCLRLHLRRLSLHLTVLGYMVIGVLVVALRPLARIVLLRLLREEVLHLLHWSLRRRGWVTCRGG
jgi:hypothetical protein